jgi:hypothetical protein
MQGFGPRQKAIKLVRIAIHHSPSLSRGSLSMLQLRPRPAALRFGAGVGGLGTFVGFTDESGSKITVVWITDSLLSP